MLGEPGFSLPERTTVVNLHSSTSESLEVNEIHAFKLVYETKMNVGTRKSRKTGSLQTPSAAQFQKKLRGGSRVRTREHDPWSFPSPPKGSRKTSQCTQALATSPSNLLWSPNSLLVPEVAGCCTISSSRSARRSNWSQAQVA